MSLSQIKQLRADLATLERVGRIGGYANGYAVDPLIGQMRHKLEKLEAQQATADEWAEVKRFIDQSPDEGSNPMVKRYIRHLEAKVAELDHELRCEQIDGGKVRDDRRAISAERNRAELTMILSSIPPACELARELVERWIESVKREMQSNGN